MLVVVLPVAEQTRPARLQLEQIDTTHGERIGNVGHPIGPLTAEEHQHGDLSRAG